MTSPRLFDTPFIGYLISRSLMGVANTMLVMTLGWHLYELTGDAWSLAFVGLAQIIPVYAFFFVSGIVIDYVPRIWVLRVCGFVEGLAVIGIGFLMTARRNPTVGDCQVNCDPRGGEGISEARLFRRSFQILFTRTCWIVRWLFRRLLSLPPYFRAGCRRIVDCLVGSVDLLCGCGFDRCRVRQSIPSAHI